MASRSNHNSPLIAATARVNVPNRPSVDGSTSGGEDSIIGDAVFLGEYTVVGQSCVIGSLTSLQPHTIVESEVNIGDRCVFLNRSIVQSGSIIESDCVVAGIIGENVFIGRGSRVFGTIRHSHLDPGKPWDADDSVEPAPRIHCGSFVGLNATVTGDVDIGPRSYVCAGAVVSRNVPPEHICFGVNKIVHHTKWNGPLAHSMFFKRGGGS